MSSNVRQLLENGVPIYPITEKSLVIGLQDAPFEYYIVAWDGSAAPTVANVPAGVVINYSGTDYTGTLAASSSTAPYLYLVASTSQQGEYDRYITTRSGSSFVWTALGSTAPVSPVIADDLVTNDSSKALSAKQGKILNDNLGQLDQEVNGVQFSNGFEVTFPANGTINQSSSQRPFVVPAGKYTLSGSLSANHNISMYFRDSQGNAITLTDATGDTYTSVKMPPLNDRNPFNIPTDVAYIFFYASSAPAADLTVTFNALSVIRVPGLVDRIDELESGPVADAEKDAIGYKHITSWTSDDFEQPSSARVLHKPIDVNFGRIFGSLTLASPYSVAVRYYDANGEKVGDSGWQTNTLSFDTNDYPTAATLDFIFADFTSQTGDISIADILAALTDVGYDYYMGVAEYVTGKLGDNGNSSYFGKEIKLRTTDTRHKFNLETIHSENQAVGNITQYTQSMAIHDGKMFCIIDTSVSLQPSDPKVAVVYDMEDFSIVGYGTIDVPRSHFNNAQFSDIFYSPGDNFPLLLLSRGDYEGDNSDFYVVRIQQNGSSFTFTVVKTLHCTIPQASYNGSWVADFAQGRLWLYSLTSGSWQTTTNNRLCMFEFKLPDLLDSSEVTLTTSDVVRYTDFGFYAIFQAATFIDGKIWIQVQDVNGLDSLVVFPSKLVIVVDPNSGVIDSILYSDTLENEGIAMFNGAVYITTKDSGAASGVVFKVCKMTF